MLTTEVHWCTMGNQSIDNVRASVSTASNSAARLNYGTRGVKIYSRTGVDGCLLEVRQLHPAAQCN